MATKRNRPNIASYIGGFGMSFAGGIANQWRGLRQSERDAYGNSMWNYLKGEKVGDASGVAKPAQAATPAEPAKTADPADPAQPSEATMNAFAPQPDDNASQYSNSFYALTSDVPNLNGDLTMLQNPDQAQSFAVDTPEVERREDYISAGSE